MLPRFLSVTFLELMQPVWLFQILTKKSEHDGVIKWKHFPLYWSFVREIHWLPVNSPHKGQWRGPLMFSLICVLNKRLSKQSWNLWFETPSRSLWRQCYASRGSQKHIIFMVHTSRELKGTYPLLPVHPWQYTRHIIWNFYCNYFQQFRSLTFVYIYIYYIYIFDARCFVYVAHGFLFYRLIHEHELFVCIVAWWRNKCKHHHFTISKRQRLSHANCKGHHLVSMLHIICVLADYHFIRIIFIVLHLLLVCKFGIMEKNFQLPLCMILYITQVCVLFSLN